MQYFLKAISEVSFYSGKAFECGLLPRVTLRQNTQECRSRGGARSLVDMAAVMGPFGCCTGQSLVQYFLKARPEVSFYSGKAFECGLLQ